MSEQKCSNCGYDMCEGMVVYTCEVCEKDCCSECTDNWGAGSVICRECDDALPQILADLRTHLAAAQAIVDKLQKTRDGVVIVPEMDVWMLALDHADRRGPVQCCVVFVEHRGVKVRFHGKELPGIVAPEECYYAREAAEAAKDKGKDAEKETRNGSEK